jgi:L-aspartate oxidase
MINDFPTVYELCKNNKINPKNDPIPISPAAHYHMGGIKADKCGRTNISGLYACGENACTGIHGANRLASNSLLEAITFADIISSDIKDQINKYEGNAIHHPKIVKVKPLDQKDLSVLRETMTKYVGVEREQVGLEIAFNTVRDIYLKYQEQGYDNNSLITSLLIIRSAINRTEQRGSHYRTDHPYQDNKLNSRSSITKEDLNL